MEMASKATDAPVADPLASLLARSADGDERAFAELYDATSARVHGWALHLLQDRASAEEVVLDVYAQAWRQGALYDASRGSVLGWMLMLTRRRTVDLLRALTRRARHEDTIADWSGFADQTASPEAAAELSHAAASGGWERTSLSGVEARPLFVDVAADRVTMLVRMAAGSTYPAHVHGGPDECYVLEGDLRVGDELHVRTGDYQRVEGGVAHPVQSTEEGCLLFIVSSLHDELIDAAHA